MELSGAEIVVQCLKDEGVEYVFGYPGGAVLHIYDAIKLTLATGIPRERCERINLGYCDPSTIDPEDWAGREDEGIILVRRDGEKLFRLKSGGC